MIACWLITPPLGIMGIIFGVVWAIDPVVPRRVPAPAGGRYAAWAAATERSVAGHAGGDRLSIARHQRAATRPPEQRELPPHVFRTNVERTLVLIKPDGVERGLVGEVISRIERKGLKLVALELRVVEAGRRAGALRGARRARGSTTACSSSSPAVRWSALVVEGPRAIAAFRQLAGGTDPVEKAATGSIRGDFGLETQFNLVHGSDSPESAAREIGLWFPNL